MAWVTFGTQVFCAQSNAAACGETLLGSWLHTRDGFIGVVFFWAGGNSAMQMIMVSWLISDMDNHHSMWGGLPANQMGWDSDTIHYPFEKMQYWGIPSWKGILL